MFYLPKLESAVSRYARVSLTLRIAMIVLVGGAGLAVAGYALGVSGDDDRAAIERFVVPGSTDQDPT